MKHFLVSLIIATVLTGASYGVGIYMDWITTTPWLEVASVFTSYSCTYLCVRESRWNFPVGIVSVTLLGILFYQTKLYSSMVLSLYLVPVLIAGWIAWAKLDGKLVVQRSQPKVMLPAALLSALTYFLVVWITEAVGGTLTQFDSAILVLSILAQYLLTAKVLESWMIWAIVNVLAIYTYFNAGTYMVAMQYVFFLANTAYGYHCWKRSIPE